MNEVIVVTVFSKRDEEDKIYTRVFSLSKEEEASKFFSSIILHEENNETTDEDIEQYLSSGKYDGNRVYAFISRETIN